MHCGTSSLHILIIGTNITMNGGLALLLLNHSRASREHIDCVQMPKLLENAWNAQQGIIVTGAIFQRGWDRQRRVPKAPTKVGRERMTHHNVSVSPVMYAAD
jgi:hypothetical protein